MSEHTTQTAREFRVRWRREGHQYSYRIYQTRAAAERKVRGILALEEVKPDTTLAEMPDLIERPAIEEREVGAWAVTNGRVVEPTDKDREGMRTHFAAQGDDGYGPF